MPHFILGYMHQMSVVIGVNDKTIKHMLNWRIWKLYASRKYSNQTESRQGHALRKWNAKGLWITGLGTLGVSCGGLVYARKIQRKDSSLFDDSARNFNLNEYIEVAASESGFSADLGTIDIYNLRPEMVQTPWELIALTHSTDVKKRRKGVCALGKLQNLHVSCCQQIAQSLDVRASVGLARTLGSDLRMLLSAPKFPITFDLRTSFYDLLTRLPVGSIDQCVHHITVSTLKRTFRNVENLNSDTHYGEITGGHLRSLPLKEVVKMCLEALLIHSTIESHRAEIVKLNGVQLLAEIKRTWPTSVTICSLISQIIGNLALDDMSHKQLFQAGWVRVLGEWLRSTHVEISLPAARALLNMDKDGVCCDIRLEHGIYVAHPLTREGEDGITGDAIFVHGLLGGAFRTWRQMDPSLASSENNIKIQQEKDEPNVPAENIPSTYTRCWPKDWLAKDMPHLRILLVDYETHLSRWTEKCHLEAERRSLDIRSVEILNKLRLAGVGDLGAIWLAHSMGGLLVKKLLLFSCNSQDTNIRKMCSNSKGVVFFSVPHKGASLPYLYNEYDYLLLPSTEVRELKPGSKHLLQLHENFKVLVENQKISCLSFGEAVGVNIWGKRVKTVLVPPDVADPGFGDFHVVPVNHLYICKPSSRKTPLYMHLEKYIRSYLPGSRKLKSPESLTTEIIMSTFPY